MANRVNYSVAVDLSSTTGGLKDIANLAFKGSSDTPQFGGARKIKLNAGQANYQVDLGAGVATGKLLVIQADKLGVDVKFNGTGNTPIPCVPLAGTTLGHLFVTTDGLTSLYLTNKDGTNACEVLVGIAGV